MIELASSFLQKEAMQQVIKSRNPFNKNYNIFSQIIPNCAKEFKLKDS